MSSCFVMQCACIFGLFINFKLMEIIEIFNIFGQNFLCLLGSHSTTNVPKEC